MPREENKNKNYNQKDTPRELPLSRKRDPRPVKFPRKTEELSSVPTLRKWKNPSKEQTMLGLDKKRNSLSRQKSQKKKTTNEVFDALLVT